MALPSIHYVDNDSFESTKEIYSLCLAKDRIKGTTFISYGDIIFKKYIPLALLDNPGDICIAVDSNQANGTILGDYKDYVLCNKPYHYFDNELVLVQMSSFLSSERIHGEWTGIMKVKESGTTAVKEALEQLSIRDDFNSLRMADLFSQLINDGHKINVIYVGGHWLDIDSLDDFTKAGTF